MAFRRHVDGPKKPSGIREITKQSFMHSTFWVQLHNVPVRCTEQEVRISIDIMQPLKKLVYVEHEEEEDISIPVAYERRRDFCFCCGLIKHPYKECENYERQPKDNLAYKVWMNAVQIYGRSKVNRSHERG